MKLVRAAAVKFISRAVRRAPDAGQIVLQETRDRLESLRGYGLDLVVLPEGVESLGQTVETAEEMDKPGPFLSLYAEWAAANKCFVAGSVKLRENGRPHNSIVFFDRQGKAVGRYHKCFLTRGERESGLIPGAGPVVVDTEIGRLGGAICFDLNFEPLRQGYRALKPDILCFASAYHGGLMQAMWAYDCRSFFVAALGCQDGGVLDPFGRPLAMTHCYATVARAAMNLDRIMVHLDFNRDKFPAIERKYLGKVAIDIPPSIGPALIYSLTEEFTAMDIAREFDLLLMDDYMAESIRDNDAVRVRA